MELLNLKNFLRPKDASAAKDFLEKNQDNTMILGGGTFVHGLVARGLVTHIETLVDVTCLPLNYFKNENNVWKIGATTRYVELENQDAINVDPYFGGILDALKYPPAQVRHAATIGGNLAASCPFFDMPVVMLAMGASVIAESSSGARVIPMTDLYLSLFQTTLAPGEYISEVQIPQSNGRIATAYEKLETNANDLALISAGVCIESDGSRCKRVSIYIGGGIGEVPFRCELAEKMMSDKSVDESLILAVAKQAMDEVDPISDHRASAEYRKAMTKILVRNTLSKAFNRISK